MTRQDEEEIMALVAELIDKKVSVALDKLKATIPKESMDVKPPAPPVKKYVKK